MLDEKTFKTVVDSAPLVSIDILLRRRNAILLGKRVNKPAQGYFFSAGGRVRKNERIDEALARIAREELNLALHRRPVFKGVFEHFYAESVFDGVSTHYVNIAFEYETNEVSCLPLDQHNEYKWFTISDLLTDESVHENVKAYYRAE